MAHATPAASFVCGDRTTATDADWAKARKDVYTAAQAVRAAQTRYDDAVRLAMDMAQSRFNAGTNKPGEADRMFGHVDRIKRGAGN